MKRDYNEVKAILFKNEFDYSTLNCDYKPIHVFYYGYNIYRTYDEFGRLKHFNSDYMNIHYEYNEHDKFTHIFREHDDVSYTTIIVYDDSKTLVKEVTGIKTYKNPIDIYIIPNQYVIRGK